MNNIGILTCKAFPELTESDQKLIPLFCEIGYNAQPVVWNDQNIDWSSYTTLIFRNTWDYFEHYDIFSQWLDKIEELQIRTYNSISVVKRNKHKFYLKELENKGVKIITSIFVEKTHQFDLRSLIPKDWQQIIIKPAVSAGSYLTEKFDYNQISEIENKYTSIARKNDLILQKYMPEIETNGEVSLVFLNKIYSHAIVKKPKTGDFRIQSQFGGLYTQFEAHKNIITTATAILQHIPESLLYARVDGLIIDNSFILMELELIEPDLYLDYTSNGHKRFLNSFIELEQKGI